MYRNDGYMKTQKTQFENRIRVKVSDEIWTKITSKFMLADEGFTSLTVNKRLKKAFVSRENGQLGGRPPKTETQKTQDHNLKRKRIEREKKIYTHGKGKLSITIKPVYAGDKIIKIHDLRTYFTHTNQIENLIEVGWICFEEFLTANAGRLFNDPDHVYNSFRDFAKSFKAPVKTNKFETAEYNKTMWTLSAWEEQYKNDLKNNEFRKHFGYAEL